jgi:four helix bundle protein
MAPYEQLHAWRASHDVVLRVYRATGAWPKHELYGLTSQARRAAFSIAANIAEGTGKRGRGEFRRYLDIAIGSAVELCYTLRVARDLGYLSVDEWQSLESDRDGAGKLLWRLYMSSARKKAD